MEQAFDRPDRECDLVMKGGITSGVVYPPAILKLAAHYRLRRIGGTSAGAIAATATAAAEYGREHNGFEKLARLSDEISQENFIFNLFQPTATTRPLMNTLLALIPNGNKQRWQRLRASFNLTRAIYQNRWLASLAGALWGAIFLIGFIWLMGGSVLGWRVLPVILFGWLVGLCSGCYGLGKILFNDVPKNSFFGLCTGLRDATTSQDTQVLTNWLSESLNDLAGFDKDGPPLTFQDLHDKDVGDDEPGITLRIVTTNLSLGRPHVLPFDTNGFLFNEREMARLFPENVVIYMVAHAYQSEHISLEKLPGYHFLPSGNRLPIVVGMRLSLSFPLLISAVPFYTIKRSAFQRHTHGHPLALEEQDLQLNWFSDGGICSNFPIHFFDAWLPKRPTFGISLMSRPEDAFLSPKNMSHSYQAVLDVDAAVEGSQHISDEDLVARVVYLPRADDPVVPEWQEIDSMFRFGRLMFGAAQNYRDMLQSMLPSYRERIVQVYFEPHEGGLNLAMDRETIKIIQQKGEQAADKIFKFFRLSHHQWVRHQVLMGLMERQLHSLEETIRETDYSRIFQEQLFFQDSAAGYEQFPYAQSEEWSKEALERIHALQEFVQRWKTEGWLVTDPPRPEPVLRVTPEL